MTAKAYIGNIPSNITENELHRYFKSCGTIVEIVCKSKFCFIEFADRKDLYRAIDTKHGATIDGCRITVEEAKGTQRDRGYDRYSTTTRNDHYGDRDNRYSDYSSRPSHTHAPTSKYSRKVHYRIMV